jgi:2-polyprenyl-3-methyl-5-hydroxy-6-metoxy-1,4-benzoquinol methylase
LSKNTNQKELIPRSEIQKHSSYDSMGYVFYWNGGVYRAIYDDREKAIRALFTCGLIGKLEENNLSPHSEITNYKTDDCGMVLQHEKIPVQTLPSEWCFSMLKDAALTVIRVNQLARKFNYQTIDAHGFNVLFYYGRPLFVDIGSFIKIENDFFCSKPGWRPLEEFQRFFYAPLKMWSKGNSYFARNSLYGDHIPMADYWQFSVNLIKLVPKKWLQKIGFYFYKYKALNTVSSKKFTAMASVSKRREKIGKIVFKIAQNKLLWLSSVNLERLAKKVEGIQQPKIPSSWADYHDDAEISPRYSYILSAIKKYDINTVLDIGGNAGFVSRMICAETDVKNVICTDYDENAVNTLYSHIKESGTSITPVVMDFRLSVTDSRFKSSQERFKSDVVLALALTHHLVLTQELTLSYIMERLRSFTNQYVFVEFMPLGLLNTRFDKLPLVPSWYTIERFREEFEKHFILLDEQKLENNRIILIGEIPRT